MSDAPRTDETKDASELFSLSQEMEKEITRLQSLLDKERKDLIKWHEEEISHHEYARDKFGDKEANRAIIAHKDAIQKIKQSPPPQQDSKEEKIDG